MVRIVLAGLLLPACAAAPTGFSLDDYRWTHRPLVVFAPDGGDARLQAQLAAVRETEAAFRDRDMLLVVVLREGRSFAGERELGPAAVRALRERFGVGADAFAVKLVGKDGGVKRSATEPFDVAAVYGQIDGMPMRQAEMRER